MLDSRVCHSIVRENLPLFVDAPKAVISRAFNLTFSAIDKIRRRGGLTSRDLRRQVERGVLPALRARGYSAWLADVGGAPVLHCVANAGTATLGLLALGFGMRLTDGQCFEKSLVSITPHAIARFLQRTDNMDFKAIIGSLKIALCVAESLRSSFLHAGCKQVAIPAGDGLFVGEFKDELPEPLRPHQQHSGNAFRAAALPESRQLYLELSTWFIPCANGRETPWRKVKAYYGMRLCKLDGLPDTELSNEVRQTASRMVTSPTIAECFPFLQNAHTRRADIVETTWHLARKQALQRERLAIAA